MVFWQDLIGSFEIDIILISIIRLTLATILGGVIGWEREQTNRPAGLRTHEVVCIGSTLCMLLSEFISTKYGNMIDTTRIGAQVISGIGFLGAGTIMKEGFSVKGLTTAASLWCVSCIGLALGAGFYSGAIIATLFIYCTLLIMKKFMINHSNTRVICLLVENIDDVYSKADKLLKSFRCTVYSTQMDVNGGMKEIRFVISYPDTEENFKYLRAKLRSLEGVQGDHIEQI
ncbi:MAG: MgtC/SapB family protein [Cellulosilyticum sp.]|nr:MgtC/SapB family protein [Cellulosilyticum sp.]MEE1071395.1 MgtC/SapB family protein [Cellulosilyticum sp.]